MTAPRPPRTARIAALALAWLTLILLAAPARAQEVSEETVAFFRQNCTSCHTVGGGRLAGPDLKGVNERRDAAWLTRFVMDPKAMIDSGDPYAQELLRAARGVFMPPVPGLTRERVVKLIEMLAVESAKEKSQFAGMQIDDRPLTPIDVERGRRLFEGRERLTGGGPSCLSCHEVDGTGVLGGGLLGPDLTAAYARLEGRKALSAWLSAPPGLTMQPVFRTKPLEGDEVLALVAFLKQSAENGKPATGRGSLAYLLSGVGGVALLLLAFDLIWKRRLRGVRRTLVGGSAR